MATTKNEIDHLEAQQSNSQSEIEKRIERVESNVDQKPGLQAINEVGCPEYTARLGKHSWFTIPRMMQLAIKNINKVYS